MTAEIHAFRCLDDNIGVLVHDAATGACAAIDAPVGVKDICIGGEDGLADPAGLTAKRYDAEPGSAYLLRPDGYVAARFRHPTRAGVAAALSRAQGLNQEFA